MRSLFDEKQDPVYQLFRTSDATDCQPSAWNKPGQVLSEKLRIPLIMATVKNHFERHLDAIQA
jgi:hypothetical protein